MTFSWDPPNATERNGVITRYSLSCAPQTGGGSIFMQYTQAGNFTLEGFTPDTPYNCSIFAINSQGNGPVASMMTHTLEDCKLPFQFADEWVYTFICTQLKHGSLISLQLQVLHHRMSCLNMIKTVLRWCSSPGSLFLQINRME